MKKIILFVPLKTSAGCSWYNIFKKKTPFKVMSFLTALALSINAIVGCSRENLTSTRPFIFFRPMDTQTGLMYRSIPFPNDLYMSSGKNNIAPSTDPNFNRNSLSQFLIPVVNTLTGFGTSSAVLFSLSAVPDISTLPLTPDASVQPTASAFIININQHSPGYGKMVPAVYIFTETSYNRTDHLYTLGIKPAYGHPLDQSTRYAAVITTGLKSADGRYFAADSGFNSIKPGAHPTSTVLQEAQTMYKSLFDILSKPPYKIAADRIACASIFTTENVTHVLENVVSWLTTTTSLPAPYFTGATIYAATNYSSTTGVYASPNFLSDPFSGSIQSDASGDPILNGWASLYFSITIPDTPPLASFGYPVVIVQHGLDADRTMALSIASEFANHGIACISIDAVGHGSRNTNGGNSVLNFINFPYPLSVRDHMQQTAIDLVQLSRLVQNSGLGSELSTLMGRPITFDTLNGVSFIGQSLGGFIGSIYMAVSPYARNGIINVGGGELMVFLLNSPLGYNEFVPFIKAIMGIPSSITPSVATDEVVLFQSILDPGDPINYGQYVTMHPLPEIGFSKNILFQMADLEQNVGNVSNESMAVAMGITAVSRSPVEGKPYNILPWFTFSTINAPVLSNASGVPGSVTSVLYQFYATHSFLIAPTDKVYFSSTFPFEPLPQPLSITNPMTQAQVQAAEFITTSTVIDPFQ